MCVSMQKLQLSLVCLTLFRLPVSLCPIHTLKDRLRLSARWVFPPTVKFKDPVRFCGQDISREAAVNGGSFSSTFALLDIASVRSSTLVRPCLGCYLRREAGVNGGSLSSICGPLNAV
ncbi:hypothetical protein BDZ88DRAFT_422804, partial [Geranomyces variabilis]